MHHADSRPAISRTAVRLWENITVRQRARGSGFKQKNPQAKSKEQLLPFQNLS